MNNKITFYALHSLFLLFIYIIGAHAQDIAPGYYRVTNIGLSSYGGTVKGKTVKEECYAYVANGSYQMEKGSGAKQNIQSMQMWTGLDNAIISPQTVIFIEKSGSNYNLEAQGKNLREMIGGYTIIVDRVSGTTDTYTLSTTVSGVDASLWVDKVKTGMYNMMGEMAYPTNYQATTTSQGAEAYRQWKLVPISSSTSNYVAVNASLEANGKYYAPYYASYPFKLVSPGMKAYFVSSISNTKYTLKEITNEVIPGATPVIIECSSKNPADCKIEPLHGGFGNISGNKLKGVYFCNLSMSPQAYSDCRTEFKAESMRVWAVKNGQLVLTNNPDKTRAVPLNQPSGFSGIWLRANESYLANVPSTAAADLVSAGAATTISFNSNGGTEVEAISGAEGDPVVAPADPTKTGYSFSGWNPALPSVFPAADMSVTAQWNINKYTITFDTDGGSTIAPITQDYQSAITPPANPTKEGSSFAGWDKAIPDIMPAENVTIKALWTTNKYTISFETDGGSTIAPITQDYGTAITAPANPTREGYTFMGWDKAIPSTMPAGNVTIKAVWKINQYTITFDTDGGSEIKPITQDYGTAVTTPANPTKEGSSFAGWNKAIPGTMPAENLTIKALWTVGQYTISFDTDGGSSVAPITQDYGTAVTAPANPTKEGYTFMGWDQTIPSTMPAGNVTIKATWKINQYTITFDTDGGSTVAPITQDYGTAITAPANPTREGFVFAGWNKAIPGTMPAENVVIKAQWNELYTLSFDTDGGSNITSITAVSGTPIVAPDDPTKTGYTFGGWNPSIPSEMPEGNMTVKATWTINKHKVTFKNYNGDTWQEETLEYGAEIKLPATNPTKEGAVFKNWSPTPAATVPDEDVVYTATFDDSEYTITFDTDGGTPVPNSITDFYHRDITDRTQDIQEPQKEGYTFDHWEPAIPSVMTGNMTIKAIWKINQYTITFNTDGGSEVTPITQDYQSAISAPAAPVREGYTFLGWNPALPEKIPLNGLSVTAQWQINKHTLTYYVDNEVYKTMENIDYDTPITPEAEPSKDGYSFSGWSTIPSTMPDNNVSVTGNFSINQYTITFNTAGGSEVTPITQDYQSAISAPADPVREGYTFLGWNPALPDKMPLNGLSVTAQWQINKHVLTYYVDNEVYKTIENIEYVTPITPESEPTKVGYSFSGWSTIPSTMPDNNVSVTGTFSINQYTITFNTDGGSEVTPITQDYQSVVSAPDDPIREGYTFLGWNPAMPDKMPLNGLSVTAQWQINEYTLTYYVDGEVYKSEKLEYNSPVTAEKDAEKEGYSFSGWNEEIPTVMPARDVTITGFFTINQYTITFNSDGGTEVPSITQDYATAINPVSSEKEGYDFAGWSPALPATMPAENMELTALWGPKEVKDTYVLNEGWSWLSFVMINEEMSSFDNVMSSLKWTSVDEIKGEGEWAIYSAKKSKWVGSLTGFYDLTMYKIHSSYADQELVLEGNYQNSKGDKVLNISKGWNYLAYLSLDAMSVDEALQNYAAAEGDVLKSQTQSATYSDGQWKGTLTTMEPRKGYMLYRNAEGGTGFCYPINSAVTSNSARASRFENTVQRFSSNMTVFAEVDGVMSVPGDSIVAVAIDGVRGSGSIDNEGRACLTIQGDNKADIYLTLLHNNEIVATANAPIQYVSDDIMGSYANPTSILFTEGTEAWSGDYNVTAVYSMDGKCLPTTDVKSLSTGLYIIKYEVSSNNDGCSGGCRVIRVVQ